MGDLAGNCPLPTLHAVSALGTRLCFYRLDTMDLANPDILPLPIAHHPTGVNDYAPAAGWEYDVMGKAKLRTVIQEVIEGCTTLAANA